MEIRNNIVFNVVHSRLKTGKDSRPSESLQVFFFIKRLVYQNALYTGGVLLQTRPFTAPVRPSKTPFITGPTISCSTLSKSRLAPSSRSTLHWLKWTLPLVSGEQGKPEWQGSLSELIDLFCKHGTDFLWSEHLNTGNEDYWSFSPPVQSY